MAGQWWDAIAALLPAEADLSKHISSKASSVSDDSCLSEAQAAVARSLIADIMGAQADDKETALWTDVDLDLNLAELHSADVSRVVAQVFTHLTASSPVDSDRHSARALARSPEDGLHSEIAQEVAYQIVARQAAASPTPGMVVPRTLDSQSQITAQTSPAQTAAREAVKHLELERPWAKSPSSRLSVSCVSGNTDSQVAQSIARDVLGPSSVASVGSHAPRELDDMEQASDGGTCGAAGHIVRDVVSIDSWSQQPRLYSGPCSQQNLSDDGNTDSIAARSVARQAVAPMMRQLDHADGPATRKDTHHLSNDVSPNLADLGMAAFFEDAVSAVIAREFMMTPDLTSVHGVDESHRESYRNTDSAAASSIARQAIAPMLANAHAHRAHAASVEEVTGQAPSEDDFGAHVFATDLVTSASGQQADERGTQSSPNSQHNVSESTDSIIVNSIVRQAVAPHLVGSESGTPGQRSHAAGAEEVSGQAPSEGAFSAHALARDLVTSASGQQADEHRTQSSPNSQHDVSENTDSIIVNSIVRQAVVPHLVGSESGTPGQRSHERGVEEVTGQAASEGAFSAHALARDLVTSASGQQADEHRTQSSPNSQHDVSENTDSRIVGSIVRQAVAPHLVGSESETPGQRSHAAGAEEVSGQAASEGAFSAHALARDLVTSASGQQADERGTQSSPNSQHDVSQSTDSIIVNSIVRQAVVPHLVGSESGTPGQRSHERGVEEVTGQAASEGAFSAHALARDLVTSASGQQADEHRTQSSPSSQHDVSENTDSRIVGSIVRQAVAPHLVGSESETPGQRSHAAGAEEVSGQAASEGAFSAHALARDLVTSASGQQADERGTQSSPNSQHDVSQSTDSIIVNSIVRQAVVPHLVGSESGTPGQRSHAAGIEEVTGQAASEGYFDANPHALTKDLVTSAGRQPAADDSELLPPSVHDCMEQSEALVAGAVALESADQLWATVGRVQLQPGFEADRIEVVESAGVSVPVLCPASNMLRPEEDVLFDEVPRAPNDSTGKSLAEDISRQWPGAYDASPASVGILSEGSVEAKSFARDALSVA